MAGRPLLLMGGFMIVRPMQRSDLLAVAALFYESFAESVLYYCGRPPTAQAMADVFACVLAAEPEGAYVAEENGQIAGYAFTPVRLSAIWREAVLGGHVFLWAWRWLTGKYGFGWGPVARLLANKTDFFSSALADRLAAEARILSIAVGEAYRGRGVGHLLFANAMARFVRMGVDRVRLDVRPDNAAALALYRSFGFQEAGRAPDPQGEWLIMFWHKERKTDA